MIIFNKKKIDTQKPHRRKVAQAYLEGITNPAIVLPALNSTFNINNSQLMSEAHVYHVFVIRCEQREALQKHLLEHGIQTLIHYPIPPHQQQAYKEWNINSYPVSELIHQQVMSLPMGPTVTDEQVAQVIAAINTFKI